MEIEGIMANLRYSMEDIRQRETQKAILKLADVDGSVKILDKLTNSIVNKIFYDINSKLKAAAKNEDEEIIRAAEYIFGRE